MRCSFWLGEVVHEKMLQLLVLVLEKLMHEMAFVFEQELPLLHEHELALSIDLELTLDLQQELSLGLQQKL